VAVLFLVLCSGINSFVIPCARVLIFVVLCDGYMCSVAFFAMDVIFGALFAGGVYFVMTFVVTHVCVLPVPKLLLILTQ
jgi:hypothetical protein